MAEEAISKKVIRELRKKTSDSGSPITFSYPGTFPIGTEGIYVNMFSGLNLEEELRIGGDKDTIIQKLEDCFQTTVKYYLSKDKTKYYKLVTKQYTTINRFLFDSNNENFIIDENKQDAQFIIFQDTPQSLPIKDKFIRISLYIAKQENGQEVLLNDELPIKEKIISYKNSTDEKTIINEQIWEDPSLENNTSNNEGD